jgi:hypothetical protein
VHPRKGSAEDAKPAEAGGDTSPPYLFFSFIHIAKPLSYSDIIYI